MRRKLKWGKTVLAIALAGAMSVTSVNLPSFSVFAAEQNEQEAQTRSMSYDGTTLTVRLQSNDLVLSPGDGKQVRDIQFFYAVYDSMEAARNDDVGDFFGKTDGAHTPTVGVDGSYSYSCERAISKGQVVRYNFNVLYNNADGTDAGACAQTSSIIPMLMILNPQNLQVRLKSKNWKCMIMKMVQRLNTRTIYFHFVYQR